MRRFQRATTCRSIYGHLFEITSYDTPRTSDNDDDDFFAAGDGDGGARWKEIAGFCLFARISNYKLHRNQWKPEMATKL